MIEWRGKRLAWTWVLILMKEGEIFVPKKGKKLEGANISAIIAYERAKEHQKKYKK